MAPLGSTHSHDKGRNRDERRTVTVFDPTDKLADTDWHTHVAAIVQVERHVYTRDVTLGEDRSRVRTNPGVFARLRSFAFNILKANRTDMLSQDRYRAGLTRTKKLLRMLAVS